MKRKIILTMFALGVSLLASQVSYAATDMLMTPVTNPAKVAPTGHEIAIDADVKAGIHQFAVDVAKEEKEVSLRKAKFSHLFEVNARGVLAFYREAHNWTPKPAYFVSDRGVPNYGYTNMEAFTNQIVRIVNEEVHVKVTAKTPLKVDTAKLEARLAKALEEAVVSTDNKELKFYFKDSLLFTMEQTIKDLRKFKQGR